MPKKQDFLADLHIHSRFSRATAKSLTLEELDKTGHEKGVHVLGTGDFLHPQWFKEMKSELEEAEQGLYKRKKSPYNTRFMLSVETSSIYSKEGKVYRIHMLIFMPSLSSVAKLRKVLGRTYNIISDGRPILGLDVRNLTEIVFSVDEHAMVIPAHIWTPWFSLFGARSGFDRIEDAFEDMTKHIFALETGLSSDPPMNWQCGALDKYTLISNSDAHSASKIGREANVFHAELSYDGIYNALSGKKGKLVRTIEYFPQEGRYYYDGHRECNISQQPTTANPICPVCNKVLTVGVLSRVQKLASRKYGYTPKNATPYIHLIPLREVISCVYNVGVNTKKVQRVYDSFIQHFGTEMDVLLNTSLDEIRTMGEREIATCLATIREGKVDITPGYDGEYGKLVYNKPAPSKNYSIFQ